MANNTTSNVIRLVQAPVDLYNYIFLDLIDHRSDSFFLMGSIWPVIAMVVLYIYISKDLGPRLMKDRPAFKIDGLVSMYNLLQVFLCLYLLKKSFHYNALVRTLQCEPVSYASTPERMAELIDLYKFCLLKMVELLDTVFFILRKKFDQISYLHVYHHAFMLMGTWIYFKFAPGGQSAFLGILNLFVHVWMYLYYFVTSTWPKYKENIWWKKHITQLQMIQFLLVFLHMLPVYFVESCTYPLPMALLVSFQSLYFFAMFYNFYVKAYGEKKVV